MIKIQSTNSRTSKSIVNLRDFSRCQSLLFFKMKYLSKYFTYCNQFFWKRTENWLIQFDIQIQIMQISCNLLIKCGCRQKMTLRNLTFQLIKIPVDRNFQQIYMLISFVSIILALIFNDFPILLTTVFRKSMIKERDTDYFFFTLVYKYLFLCFFSMHIYIQTLDSMNDSVVLKCRCTGNFPHVVDSTV